MQLPTAIAAEVGAESEPHMIAYPNNCAARSGNRILSNLYEASSLPHAFFLHLKI